MTFSPRGLPAPPLFILLYHIFKTAWHFHREGYRLHPHFHPLVSYLHKRHFHREGYRLHPSSSSCFISSKTTFSPRGFPPPPLFILLFHIFKNCVFTERATGSTPFHPLVSYLQKQRFHREGYRLHPFSSSCFISSKTTFSPRELPAPPLFILLFHIFKNDIFSERVTGSTPLHPLVSYLQKRHFHREGYRLHPFSSSCFISSKTAFSPRGLPAPPLFILLFHIFKNDVFTERVTGPTPFHVLVSYLQKRRFHREGYRLHPFSSSCFISSKTAFSPRGLPAPPLFVLLFHIFKNDIFTERVNGATPFHPLVSYLQKQHCTERVTGSTPFHPLASYLRKRHFHREGYRLHPFSSSCFISSHIFAPGGLPAPPLFMLLFHIFKNGAFTNKVTGSTPFHLLVSYLQKTTFSWRWLPAPPLFILLFHIFKNGIFTERVTGSTPFHPLVSIFKDGIFTSRVTGSTPFHRLVSYLQKQHFTENVTGSTPFHLLVSYLQKRHVHREGYRLHPFSSS